MTVYRVGPSEDKEQHTVSLGKVLVTTDDLDALTDILRRKIYSPEAPANKPGPKRHRVEFDGGHFDETSDLPTLTDEEARSLKIEGRDDQVILSAERAVAIGDKKEAEDIYKLWARSRQTKEPPRSRRLSNHPLIPPFVLSLFLTFAAITPLVEKEGSRPFYIPISRSGHWYLFRYRCSSDSWCWRYTLFKDSHPKSSSECPDLHTL